MSKPTPAPLPREDGLYWVKMAEKHVGGFQPNWDKAEIGPWHLVDYHYDADGYNLVHIGSDDGGQWGNPDNKYCNYVVVEVSPKVEPPK